MQRLLAIAMLLGSCMVLAGQPAPAQSSPSIDEELAAMAFQGDSYDPQNLDALGLDGLAGVLDRIFPESAPPPKKPPEEAIRRLIAQLGDDEFRVREEATRQLVATARPSRELVTEATGSDDAEVRLRARLVLDAWQPQSKSSWQGHLPGLSNYFKRIKDRERLVHLARRMAAVLEKGFPPPDDLRLIRQCLIGIAEGGDEASGEVLRPLIRHEDAMVAFLVAHSIAAYKRDDACFANLLLESDRDEVVEAAIKWARYGGQARTERLRKALRQVFDRRGEPLKFQASHTLMHDFQDDGAGAYLLAQTKSPDTGRAYVAITMVGDAAKSGHPATKEILDHLDPHLRSTNAEFRRAAAKSLATYSGDEVIRRLVPLLGDLQTVIADETKEGLAGQPDKALLGRLLAEAAAGHGDARIRARAEEVLDKLDGK